MSPTSLKESRCHTPPPCPRAFGDPSPPVHPNVIPSPSRNLVAITRSPSPSPRACGDPSPPLKPACHSESLKESRCAPHAETPAPCPRACVDPSPPLEPNVIPSPSEESRITPHLRLLIACGDPSPPLKPNVIPSPSRNLVAITPPLRVLAHAGTHPLLLNQMSFRSPSRNLVPSRLLTSSPRRGGSRTTPTHHHTPSPCPRACGDPSPPLEPQCHSKSLKESRRASCHPLRVLAHAGTHPLLLNQMSFRVPQGISLPSCPPSPCPHRLRGPIPSS